MKSILAATVALALGACATAAPAPSGSPAGTTTAPASASASAAIDPVGAYEFTAQVNGQAVTGTMEISGTPGAYTGRVVTSRFPEFPLRSASAAGQELTVVAQTPNGDVTFRMMFTGADFTGGWTLAGDSGPLSGRRTR